MTTGKTPFFTLLWNRYVAPIKQTIPNYRIENFNEASNDELLALETDLLEEIQNYAQVQVAAL